MSRIELAPELITEIGALYENKESIASICWSKNISPAIIIRALSEAGYKIRGKLRSGVGPEAVQLYQDGATYSELASIYNCSTMAIRYYLVRAGVKPRKPGRRKHNV